MNNVPQSILDLLDSAELDLEAAHAADEKHDEDLIALAAAENTEANSRDSAIEAHQTANKSASALVAAVKEYFGLNLET